MWVDGVYGGIRSISAIDAITLATQAGPLVVQAAQRLTVAEAAAVAARCLGNPVCMAATAAAAAAAYAFWQRYRIKPAPGGEGIVHDEGQPPENMEGFICSGGSVAFSAMACYQKAAADAVSAAQRSDTSGQFTYSLKGSPVCTAQSSSTSCGGYYIDQRLASGGPWSTTNIVGSYNKGVVKLCPTAIDFSDPVYNQPGGPVMQDGKCPTGRYSGTTTEQAAAKVAAFPPDATDTVLRDVVREAVDKGAMESPAELELSGPASKQGTPISTTTQTPNGTVTETKTPTYSYVYEGDTITYNISTTNITNNNGQTTTSTTTGEKEQRTDCDKFPDSVGCLKLGPAPTDQVQKRQTTLIWAAEAISLPVGCPPDVPLFGEHKFSWQMTCDTAVKMKPFILAGAAITALMIVLAALRSS